ncbi:unnamed protein product [Chironomus riparius]|uniref:Uncharacterized protein n=1 Tax=Chironomus riparius TaxID=315576 RepID=A0A9N9RZW6_9DIPT|nr:unnamed protein product [Chironomus riparius]
MKFSILFFIIGTTISIINAVDYKCDYNNRYISFADETFYDCKLVKGTIDDESERDVESITGRHLRKLHNSKVESLSIKKKIHTLMPHNVESYFENLICLDIYEVGLKEIHQEDLEQCLPFWSSKK